MKLSICFAILGLALAVSCDQTQVEYTPVVELEQGKVRGQVIEVEGKKVNFYQGIKFATAKRFGLPEPVAPWNDILDAVSEGAACPQPLMPEFKGFQNEHMDEDCLYLNIWVPAEESFKPRAVLYHIHGGAFTVGTIFAPLSDAKYLAARGDLIVVAVQYRLGLFGYGKFGNVPDNLGYRDQIFGLQWVQQNIHLFGGSPNDVTIQGPSAGSISVGALILSPLTSGLFHRAILQGGAPNCLFTVSEAENLEKVKDLAERVKCPETQLEECLRTKPAQELANAVSMEFTKHEFIIPTFGGEVLPLKPSIALKTGQFQQGVDVLFGVAKDEGSFFVAGIFPKLLADPANLTIEETKKDIAHMMREIYKLPYADQVAEFYTKDLVNPTEEQLKVAISDAWGHLNLLCPTIRFGEQLAQHQPNQHYYAFQMAQAMAGPIPTQPWMGVMHGMDSMYILGVVMQTQEKDKQVGHDMIHAWADFVKTGHIGTVSGAHWEEAFQHESHEKVANVMKLNADDYRMLNGYYKKACNEFWGKLEDAHTIEHTEL